MDKKDEDYIYYLVAHNLKIQRNRKHLTFSLGTIWKYDEVLEIDVRKLFKPIDDKVLEEINN